MFQVGWDHQLGLLRFLFWIPIASHIMVIFQQSPSAQVSVTTWAEKVGFDSSSRTSCSYSIDGEVPWIDVVRILRMVHSPRVFPGRNVNPYIWWCDRFVGKVWAFRRHDKVVRFISQHGCWKKMIFRCYCCVSQVLYLLFRCSVNMFEKTALFVLRNCMMSQRVLGPLSQRQCRLLKCMGTWMTRHAVHP